MTENENTPSKARGGWSDPVAAGKLGGKRSGEARRARAEARRAEEAHRASAANESNAERGGALADRRRLEAIRDNPGAADRDVIAAVRALQDLDKKATPVRSLPPLATLYSLSTAELEALVVEGMESGELAYEGLTPTYGAPLEALVSAPL